MRFPLRFERLEQRENPSDLGGGDGLPPIDPINVPPAPGPQDPGHGSGTDPSQPPVPPANPPGGGGP
jgi:hypothetical protein